MKRSCKHIDIKDEKTVLPWVIDCVSRHYKRRDFRKLLIKTGRMSESDYNSVLLGDKKYLWRGCENIAKEAVKQISERKLVVLPCRIEKRQDKSTRKMRLIGKECAMQQVLGYIAVYSCQEIWKRRIVPQQASSFKYRGQTYGASIISKWLNDDDRASKWAESHGKRYVRQCKYHVKLDVEQCFPSLRTDVFMQKFKKDCANEDIIWLWNELLESYHVKIADTEEIYEGFMIGAMPSQWGCQYLLSFAYRYVMGLHSNRRAKPHKAVKHSLFFMDDMQLAGSSRRELKMAVRKLIAYIRNELCLNIKPNWQICGIYATPIDMMGFRFNKDGNITVRPRIFVRLRRTALRISRAHYPCLRLAQRILSYKGFVQQNRKRVKSARLQRRAKQNQTIQVLKLRSAKIRKKLLLKWIFKMSALVIRRKERTSNCNDSFLQRSTRRITVYAVA